MRAPPLLKEPLIHFVLIGAVLFLVGRVADDGSSAVGNRIVVTQGVVQQMIATFTRTWQRPPTEGEVVGLVDDYIREQVYVREALALGLDRDDAIIRRRLR